MRFSTYRSTVDDIEGLSVKDCYSIGEVGCSKDLVNLSYGNEDSIAASFGVEGVIYGVAGSYRNWDGVAQGWAIFGKDVDRYPIALTKLCHGLIVYAAKKQNLRRISLTVRNEYTKGNQFAYRLGFDFEGVMRGFLPDGGDANLYARLF